MADSPTERRPRTPLPPRQDGKPPAGRPGGQAPARLPRLPGGRSFWMVVLGLLVLNYVIMALFAPGREPSVRIPYSSPEGAPGFVQMIDQNKILRVNMEGASVNGEFREAQKYPDSKAEPTKNFDTELPTPVIYDSAALLDQLNTHKVKIEATPINTGRGFFASLILGFGPVILLVFLFVWLSRRGGGGQMGGLGAVRGGGG